MKVRDLQIKEISYQVAMDCVVKNHYLHRVAPCSFSWGLFDKDLLVGVVCYGTPFSAPLRSGICGVSECLNVIELTRLWIQDGYPKNCASFLVGNTLKKVDKEIIVSFADTAQNHTGIVYQATNFYYTGLTPKKNNWTIKNNSKHSQTLADKFTAKQLREQYGSDFTMEPRSQKHRYIFFNCDKKRKKELLLKLRYDIMDYPKKER